MSDVLLTLDGLVAGYGDLEILHGVDLAMSPGEIVLIFGPNGSGKSTMVKTMCGLADLQSGSVVLDGEDVSHLAPEQVVQKGISYVPQVDNVFPNLSVAENMEIGGVLSRRTTRQRFDGVMDLFPALLDRRQQQAGTLSGGERQLVAMGRALMLEPKLLMLDEPSAGLAPRVVDETFASVQQINREAGIAVLLVEQNVRQAIKLADRGYLLEAGEVKLADTASAIAERPEVASAYLGSNRDASTQVATDTGATSPRASASSEPPHL